MGLGRRHAWLLSLALGTVCAQARACEPAAFDFPQFLKDLDRSSDGYLQQEELVGARYDPARYLGQLEKPPNTAEAFAELDANRDRRLSLEELWNWGRYTHNACAGMTQTEEAARPGLVKRLKRLLTRLAG